MPDGQAVPPEFYGQATERVGFESPSITGEALGQVAAGGGFESLSSPIQVALFLGALAFLSAAMVSLTSFARIVIVLSFVRRALTTQEIPPNTVLLGLPLFLTLFIMGPTFDAIKTDANVPYLNNRIEGKTAIPLGAG